MMGNREHAQQGVINAIYLLKENSIFPDILNQLQAKIVPAYLKLLEALHRSNTAQEHEIHDYKTSKANRERRKRVQEQQRQLYDRELKKWIERFRMTMDGTPTGEPLKWIMEFVADECKYAANGRDAQTLPSSPYLNFDDQVVVRRFPVAGIITGPPSPEDWSVVVRKTSGRRAEEPFSQFWSRIEPDLKSAARELWRMSRQKGTRSKRRPVHYQWFVLRRFASWTYHRIEVQYTVLGYPAEESNIRKAVQAVEKQLGLVRTGN
jgi:hypothetical protein